jgi:uncharacterized Zn finger protein
MKEPCKKCGSYKGSLVKISIHNKLSCAECGAFIKFVSAKETIELETVKNASNEVTLEEVNFKLDLILSHLGIVEK